MIKLVIFDLDGTLVDTAKDITNSLNYALRPYGFRQMTPEETVGLVGEGLTRLIAKIVGARADLIPSVSERFVQYYSDHLTEFSELYPHVRETLPRLENYKKAVISNKRELLSRRLLEQLSVAEYFDLILGSDSVEEKKPSPKPVWQVLHKFSVERSEAVIVGDSIYDMESGKAAGIRTVAVTYGFMPESVSAGADRIINRFDELPPVLELFSK